MQSQRRRRGLKIKEENEGLTKYFVKLVSLFSFVALLSILMIQFVFSYSQVEPTVFHKNNPILVIGAFLLFVVVQFYIQKLINLLDIPTKKLRNILLVFTGIIGLSVATMFISAPIFDARSVVNGLANDSGSAIRYAEYYSNNVGLVLLYQAIFNIFGRQAWFLMYVVNVLSVVGIFALLPALTKLISKDEKAERMTIQIEFFALPFIFVISYLYNDLIGLFLALLSMYLLLLFTTGEDKKNRYIVTSGFALGLAYVLRTNTLIFIIGFALYLILRVVRDKKFGYSHLMSFVPLVIVFVMQFLFQVSLPKMIPNYTNEYSQPSISWMAMAVADKDSIKGYNYQKEGMYNGFEGWVYEEYKKEHAGTNGKEYIKDIQGRKEIYSKFLKQRLKYFTQHPLKAVAFYSKKEVASWGDASFGGDNLLKSSYDNQSKTYNELPFKSVETINAINAKAVPEYENNREKLQSPVAMHMVRTKSILNFIQRPFLMFTVLGVMFLLIRKKFKLDLESFLFLLIFFGGFVFHQFIWETQPRYFLPYLAMLMPLASIGMSDLFVKLSRKKKSVL